VREIMPQLGSRNALLLAVVFAAVVVVLSTVGPGLGALSITLLPMAGIFVVLYFVVRWAVRFRDAGFGATTRTGTLTAREILDARYAGGEIGPEDYERMRSRLETP